MLSNLRLFRETRPKESSAEDLSGAELVRTFDPQKWDYLKRVAPEPVPYYSYGILSRFMASHSAVLDTKTQPPSIAAAALRSPKGNLTIYALNRGGGAKHLRIGVSNLEGSRVLYKYQVTEWTVGALGYHMDPIRSFAVSPVQPELSDQVPGESITVYSTLKLTHADPGITVE